MQPRILRPSFLCSSSLFSESAKTLFLLLHSTQENKNRTEEEEDTGRVGAIGIVGNHNGRLIQGLVWDANTFHFWAKLSRCWSLEK